MRTILLALCILSVTVPAKAQLFGKKWTEGCYYDLNGNKVSGLISWPIPEVTLFKGKGDQIFYKTDKDSVNLKLQSTEIKAFVIGKDSFVVSQYEGLKKCPFVLVALDKPTKIYLSTTLLSSSIIPGGSMRNLEFSAEIISNRENVYYYGTDANNLTMIERKYLQTSCAN